MTRTLTTDMLGLGFVYGIIALMINIFIDWDTFTIEALLNSGAGIGWKEYVSAIGGGVFTILLVAALRRFVRRVVRE